MFQRPSPLPAGGRERLGQERFDWKCCHSFGGSTHAASRLPPGRPRRPGVNVPVRAAWCLTLATSRQRGNEVILALSLPGARRCGRVGFDEEAIEGHDPDAPKPSAKRHVPRRPVGESCQKRSFPRARSTRNREGQPAAGSARTTHNALIGPQLRVIADDRRSSSRRTCSFLCGQEITLGPGNRARPVVVTRQRAPPQGRRGWGGRPFPPVA